MVTGFLGSGKTTLIGRLLGSPAAEGTAVLVNEVGEIAIDHHLVEHVAEDVQVLASGCLCCTLRDDLAGALERTERAAAVANRTVRRVILETTGVADPAPIVHSAARDPRLVARLETAGVIAVVDAARGLALLDEHPEVARQIDLADRVLLTKLDIAPERAAALLEAELSRRFPGRAVSPADPHALLATAPALQSRRAIEGWLEPLHAHGPDVDVRCIELPSPVNLEALALWHRIVTGLDGRSLLRIKGIVETEDGGRWVLQSAQHAVFEPRRVDGVGEGWRGSRLVVASRGLAMEVVDRMAEAAGSAARGVRRR